MRLMNIEVEPITSWRGCIRQPPHPLNQAWSQRAARRSLWHPTSLATCQTQLMQEAICKTVTLFVSAVICTRNRSDKIGNAVNGLANTYPNFDLTIIDQSTNDETETIIAPVGERDGRVRYQRMSKSGLSRAYNLAIATRPVRLLLYGRRLPCAFGLDREDREGLRGAARRPTDVWSGGSRLSENDGDD